MALHASRPLPVTLLSGFLGAGKTTLLRNILANTQDAKVAVIVNDMAELNIDASLIKHSRLIQAQEKLVEMQNGCICCTLREDLLHEIAALVEQDTFDQIVIESTGVSEPQQVAETFDMELEESNVKSLKGLAALDNCVTVLDAAELYGNLTSIMSLKEMQQAVSEEDARNVAELLLDQIEFANVILLNKQDLVPDIKRRDSLLAAVKALNPEAKVKFTTQCKVPMTDILNTGNFDMERAAKSAGWLHSLRNGASLISETVEYGITSFVYRARKPFHPQKLYDFIVRHFLLQQVALVEDADGECDGHNHKEASLVTSPKPMHLQRKANDATERFGKVLRSKGFVWLAKRDDLMGEWSSAGSILNLTCGGPWFAAIPQEAWPDVEVAEVMRDFQEPHGDRRQELVFIGQDLNQAAITDALDACLCAERNLRKGKHMPDPFVAWPELDMMEVEVTDEESEEEPETK